MDFILILLSVYALIVGIVCLDFLLYILRREEWLPKDVAPNMVLSILAMSSSAVFLTMAVYIFLHAIRVWA